MEYKVIKKEYYDSSFEKESQLLINDMVKKGWKLHSLNIVPSSMERYSESYLVNNYEIYIFEK